MMVFTCDIKTTDEDLKELTYFTQIVKKWWVRPLMFITAFGAAFFLTLGIMGKLSVWIGISVAIISVAFIAGSFIRVNLIVKNGIRDGIVPLGNVRKLRIFNDSFELSGGRTNTCIKKDWNTIFEAFERKNCYILYLTIASTFVIPKSQLKLEQQYELSNCLVKYLGRRYHRTHIKNH